MRLPAAGQAAPDVGLPRPGSIDSIGVNIHFTDPGPGEMQQIAAAGFKWVRMDFSWAGIERTEGAYNFAAYDRLMASLDRFKIRPIFILDYGNDLYEKGSPKSPEARAAFARFAAAAVTHFKGRGILWEMWNEPNGGFWLPKANVDEYIALALETGKAIKAAAPAELYIGPATSGMDFSFIEKCFQAGLLNYWDAVSFHPYRNSEPETAARDFERVKALIGQYAPQGKQIPILSGEWGYSELYPGLNLDLQGKYISREFLTDISNDLIVSIWYDWHDDGPDPKEPEHHFGTVYRDYRPKPAYLAAQTLSATLAGCRFNKRLALQSSEDYCLLFSGPGDRVCLAAWTTQRAPHAVTLPASRGEFEQISNTGERSKVTSNGEGLRVQLTGAPVYLKPAGRNALLEMAAGWQQLPTSQRCDDERSAEMALQGAFYVPGLPASGEASRISIVCEDSGEPVGVHPSARRDRSVTFTNLGWHERDADGRTYRVTLSPHGGGPVSQRIRLYAAHPLTLVAAPPAGNVLHVTIYNPTGAEIHGRLRDGAGGSYKEVAFKQGEHSVSVEMPAHAAEGGYRVELQFEEENGGSIWRPTVASPPVEFVPYENFAEYPNGGPPATGFTVEPDGDPKVGSKISLSIDNPPPGLPGAAGRAARIDYKFEPGWKFLRLAPRDAKHELLRGQPTALGEWLFGDGSGNVLNARYVDSTGQTFQTSAGAIDWTDWRYVQFSLEADHASHWGGANDGAIHYPIRLDTVTLVDSRDRRACSGTVWVADLTLIRKAAN